MLVRLLMDEYVLAKALVRAGLADVSSSLWRAQDIIADMKRHEDSSWAWTPGAPLPGGRTWTNECMEPLCPDRATSRRHEHPTP
jgi:hypothetical protein